MNILQPGRNKTERVSSPPGSGRPWEEAVKTTTEVTEQTPAAPSQRQRHCLPISYWTDEIRGRLHSRRAASMRKAGARCRYCLCLPCRRASVTLQNPKTLPPPGAAADRSRGTAGELNSPRIRCHGVPADTQRATRPRGTR